MRLSSTMGKEEKTSYFGYWGQLGKECLDWRVPVIPEKCTTEGGEWVISLRIYAKGGERKKWGSSCTGAEGGATSRESEMD